MDGQHASDRELLERIGRGDERAFAVVYSRYADLVYSVSLRVLRDAATAQDVAQDVFLRVWREPWRFEPERGKFAVWLASVTRNRALDMVRSQGRRRAVEYRPPEDAPEPVDGSAEDPQLAAEVASDTRLVRAAMSSLPEEQRRVVELAYFDGLSQREISERLQVPLGTVKTRARLAMQKLRLTLAGLVTEER